MIQLKNVNKIYGHDDNEIIALNNINLTLPEKGLVIIIGESGSGKSTLLNCLSKIEKINSGEIEGISKEEVSFVFQDYQLIENLSVKENLVLFSDNISNIDFILDKLDLLRFKNKKVNELSGGQKQRVAIARSIILNTKYLFADEPTGNLDSDNSMKIAKILKEISSDKLVLIVTHNQELFNKYADRIITISHGKISSDHTFNFPVKEETDENKFDKNNEIPLNIKKLVKLKRSTNSINHSTKIFNIIFSCLLFVTLFLGINISFESRGDILYNACQHYQVQTLDFYKYFKNEEYQIPLVDEDIDRLRLSKKDYAICSFENLDYYDPSDNYTYRFNKIYLSSYVKNLNCGTNDLNEDEIILSYESAKQLSYHWRLHSEISNTNNFDFSKMIGKEITIMGRNLKIVGVEKNARDYFSFQDMDKSYSDYNSYFYCSEETRNNIHNDYVNKCGAYSVFLGDGTNSSSSFYSFLSSLKNRRLIKGEYPSNNNEISLSESDANQYLNIKGITSDDLSCLFGEIIECNYFFKEEKLFKKEFVITGITDESCVNNDTFLDTYQNYSSDHGNYLSSRQISLLSDSITTSTINKLLKNNFASNCFINEEVNLSYSILLIVGIVLLVVSIPFGIILIVFQMVNAKQKIYSNRRIIGILKSLSFENKRIVNLFVLDSLLENVISFIMSLVLSPIIIFLINRTFIEHHFASFNVIIYNYSFILIIFLSLIIVSFASIYIILRKLNKKSDVDLIYER